MNNSVIKGTEFSYRIDTEHGINHDGFIAEGTESIVFKGVKYGGDLRYSCALKFKPKYRLNDFLGRLFGHIGFMVINILSGHLTINTARIATQCRNHHMQTRKISQDAFLCSELCSKHIHHIPNFISRCNLL